MWWINHYYVCVLYKNSNLINSKLFFDGRETAYVYLVEADRILLSFLAPVMLNAVRATIVACLSGNAEMLLFLAYNIRLIY